MIFLTNIFNNIYFTQICLADQFCKIMSNVNSCFYLFYYPVCLNLFGYLELLLDYLQFSGLCGIQHSVTLSRIDSVHQMNATDFVKLKSSVKNISYFLIQAEYHVFIHCINKLLLLCLVKTRKL